MSTQSLSEGNKQAIQKAFDTYLEKGLHVHYEQKQALHRSKSGKLKQFTSYL